MKAQHTLGRLKVGTPPPNGQQTIGTESGLMVAVATAGVDHPSKANARRLVAAWNACDGIDTKLLEDFPLGVINAEHARVMIERTRQSNELLQALARVEQKVEVLILQRDALLEFAKEWLSRQGTDDNYMTAKAKAAIAKITGDAA